MSQDCIFCRIVSGKIESDVLYRDETCFVIRDIEPRAPVHLLVIPIRHFTYLKGSAKGESAMVGSMVAAATNMAEREGLGDGGYRLVINQGSDAGQVVNHLHLHLLGGAPLGTMG